MIILSALSNSKPTKVRYTNYKGQTLVRTIKVVRLYWGSNEWHPEDQWLLDVMDMDKGQLRTFALKDMIPYESQEVSKVAKS